MKLLNVNREMCDKLPERKLQILDLFGKNRDLIEYFFFIKCKKCQKTVKCKSGKSEQVMCCDNVLKKIETNFFVYLPIKKQLSNSI